MEQNYLTDKSWMYKYETKHDRVNPEFLAGVKYFIQFALSNMNDDGSLVFKCPCSKCENKCYSDKDTIHFHLIREGFTHGYTTWHFHGESRKRPREGGNPLIGSVGDIVGMLNDAFLWQHAGDNAKGRQRNQEVDKFEQLMEEAKKPLYQDCNKYSRLSFIVCLFQLKCLHKWNKKSFSAMLSLFKVALPIENTLPSSWYESKKMMSELGLACKRIHACPNDCILFRNEFKNLDKCPKCNASRWKQKGDGKGGMKNVPVKVFRHFPLIPRLQGLFMSNREMPPKKKFRPLASVLQKNKSLVVAAFSQDRSALSPPSGARNNESHVNLCNETMRCNAFTLVRDVPVKKRRTTQFQNAYEATISRVVNELESTPTVLSWEHVRQDHISDELLQRDIEEMHESNSSYGGATAESTSTTRKTRGPTQKTAVEPPKGKKWKCMIVNGQAVGDEASKLATALGLYARNDSYFLPYKEWKEQSIHSFNDVMKEIMVNFDFVDSEGMPANMAQVIKFCKVSIQNKIREWRNTLKKTTMMMEGVLEEGLIKPSDERISQITWNSLLQYWGNEKKTFETKRNKKNRAKEQATHTLGAKSIARHNQEECVTLGANYTTLGAYIKAHQTKNGNYPNEYTCNICEKVIATCVEKDIANSAEPAVLSSILDNVCNGHHGGYERGCGLAWSRVTPWGSVETQASNDNIKQLTLELQSTQSDFQHAKAQLEAMHNRE